MVSECSLLKVYFARDWPLLSPVHGFNFLGVVMLVIGNNTLGNLNKEATSQASLGIAWWRLVIGSGIVVFILGFINILSVSESLLKVIHSNLNRATSFVTNLLESQHAKFEPKEL